jgi:glutathione synthase/RimK-type ligase-like ATP-grasp enzyme
VSAPRLAVVGNPGNRRVELFKAAAASLGLADEPRVVPWIEALRGRAAFEAGEVVRIDSPGEDAEVTRLLRGEAGPVDMYRVEGTRAWYEGFVAALEKLHAEIESAGAVALASARDTAIAFDKTRTNALLAEHGIPVPEAIPGAVDYATLRTALREHDCQQAHVKIRHGSSASGVVAVSLRGDDMWATTSTELHRVPTGYELYNSLKMRHYRRERELAVLFDGLAADGLHVERTVRMMFTGGKHIDLRLVTVGGKVTHAVGRASDRPITNLHLGGQRIPAAQVRDKLGEQAWRQVIDVAERTAACFPDSHCLGVDVLPDQRAGVAYVGEVNAYGDLLPNLLGLPGTLGEGVDTYTAQLLSLREIHG